MRFRFAVLLFVPAVLLPASPASAHERRQVGAYEFVVGWGDEPALTGFKNRVQLILNQGGQPVVDLGETLKVEVMFGDEKMGPLQIEPRFRVGAFGQPGDYGASVVPNRAGEYKFHFTGDVRGQRVDETFTSSDKTFDSPQDTKSVQFPADDPSVGELTARVDRLAARTEEANRSASARAIVTGLLAGAALLVALGVGLMGRRRTPA